MGVWNCFTVLFVLSFARYSIQDDHKYKITVLFIEKCSLPESRYYKFHQVDYTASATKLNRATTVINASFNVTEKIGPLEFSIRGYQVQQNNVKNLDFKLENLKCTHFIPKTVAKMIKVQFDKECKVMPGNYVVQNINFEEHAAFFAKAMTSAGKYAFDLEFIVQNKGVVACVAITFNFSSAKKHH